MGPSGAGKDSLLNWLRQNLAGATWLHWAKRSITRPADAGGEQHQPLREADFVQLLAQGVFALHWQANGLQYGIPATELEPLVRGDWVVVNGSRSYLPEVQARYPGVTVVHIHASAPVLEQRLLQRGRESESEVRARVRRALDHMPRPQDVSIDIANDGRLDSAGRQLLKALAALPHWPGPAHPLE